MKNSFAIIYFCSCNMKHYSCIICQHDVYNLFCIKISFGVLLLCYKFVYHIWAHHGQWDLGGHNGDDHATHWNFLPCFAYITIDIVPF